MKSKLLMCALIGILMSSGLLLSGCNRDCYERNSCHGGLTAGVFTGNTLCGRSSCPVETLQRNAATIQDSPFVFCTCDA